MDHTAQTVRRKDRRQHNSNKHKKYVGSNASGQGFADVRKRKAQHEYFKMLKKMKKERVQPEQQNASAQEASQGMPRAKDSKRKEMKQVNRFSKAMAEAKQRKTERNKKKEEAEKRQQEREEAMKKSKAERREKYLKLCKRTHKGQPIMRYRIEHLLEQAEKLQQNSSGKS